MDAEDNLKNIRQQLLYDKIRGMNTFMNDDVFQVMKDLSAADWADAWLVAGLTTTYEDLIAVHDLLWPVVDTVALKIASQSEVEAAINDICLWLKAGTPELTEQSSEGAIVSPIERLVGRLCHQLLDAADVDDMGGCPLCKG